MHIIYFHQHFSTPSGATGTRSYEMARRLIVRGHRVTVVCGSSDQGTTGLTGAPVGRVRRGQVDGIDVIEVVLAYSNRDRFLRRALTFLRFALRGIGIAVRTPYDLLFATSTPLTAGIPGIVMRLLKPGRPFVFEVRDLWPELPRAMGVISNPLVLSAMSALEWLSYRSARACVALSPGIEEGIRRRAPRGQPIAMIPNGCDLELFRPRQDADRTDGKLRAVFTGAHGMANGLGAVLDAAAVLKQLGRDDTELHFIGDGRLKPDLQRRAAAEGLDNCVFHDPVPKTMLAERLAGFDVGLMILANVPAFYYGTSPNKFFDYLSAGLPVLNNYPGWLAEMIQEHDCGIAIPADDPRAFAEALLQLADAPERRAKMAANSRRLAEEQFGRERLSSQFVDFLEGVAEGAATP